MTDKKYDAEVVEKKSFAAFHASAEVVEKKKPLSIEEMNAFAEVVENAAPWLTERKYAAEVVEKRSVTDFQYATEVVEKK